MALWRRDQKGALFTCLDYSCPAVYCSLKVPEEQAVFWRPCDLNTDCLARARTHTHTYTCVLQLHVSLTVLHHGVQKGGRLCCSLQLRPDGLRISLASPWKRSHSTLVLMMTKRRPPWTVWSRSSAGFWPDFSVSNTWRWADAVFVAFRGMWFVHRRSGSSCSSPFWRRTARRSWWSSSLPACLSNITMSCSTTLTFLSWPSMWVSSCLSCFHLQEQLL